MKASKLHYLIMLLALMLGGSFALQAQRGRLPFPSTSGRNEDDDHNNPRRRLQKRMIRESFEQMQKESEKLVEMSTDLRETLLNTSEDELSLEVMKKAEEIEKLAEKIKNRMKNL